MAKQKLVVSFMVELYQKEDFKEIKKWEHHIEYLIEDADCEEISNVKVTKVADTTAKVTFEIIAKDPLDVGRIIHWENDFPADLDDYDEIKAIHDVTVLHIETVKRFAQADEIIKIIETWKKQVASYGNENRDTDCTLEVTQDKLNKLADDGIANTKMIRSEVLVGDDFMEDLNNHLAMDYKDDVTMSYVVNNYKTIMNDSTRKSALNCSIKEFICRRLGAYSKINK